MKKSCPDRLIKKQKVEDTQDNITDLQKYDDLNPNYKSSTKISAIDWIDILCSDWLSVLIFQYLEIEDITRLDIAICNRNLRQQWLVNLGTYTSSASLKLLDSVVWSDALINWIILRNLHFSELAIMKGYSQITNDGMYRLAQRCPSLKRLQLSSNETIENDQRFQHLSANFYKLKYIKLSMYDFSSNDCVNLGACEQLEFMNINSNYWSGNSLLSEANVKAIFGNTKLLKTLEVRYDCVPELLLELGTNCPLLEHLYISRLRNVLPEHIEVFTQGCKKLESVELNDIQSTDAQLSAGLKDKFIECLGNNCPLLKTLIIKSSLSNSCIITEAALKSLAQGCPLLEVLYIDHIKTLPAEGVAYLAVHCQELYDISFPYSDISDDVLVELGKIESLSELNISNCQKITDDGINSLVEEDGSNLEYLDLDCCFSLTNDSLFSIGEHCPNLLGIVIAEWHVSGMTTAGMMQMVKKCQRLYEFSYCGPRTDTLEIALIRRFVDDREKNNRQLLLLSK